MKKLGIISLLLLFALLLCACSASFDYQGKYLIDNKTGIKYTYAPFCYEPVSLGTEYATQDKAGIKTVYYTVGSLSSDEWLASEDLTLFYAEGIKLPTFSELDVNRILICEEGESIVSYFDVKDAEKVKTVANEYIGADFMSGSLPKADVEYVLKFRGDAYPFLQYSLVYLQYDNGLVKTDTTNDLTSYKYLYTDEQAEIAVAENEDGSYTVEYNLGKYFLYNKYEYTYCKIGDTIAIEITE